MVADFSLLFYYICGHPFAVIPTCTSHCAMILLIEWSLGSVPIDRFCIKEYKKMEAEKKHKRKNPMSLMLDSSTNCSGTINTNSWNTTRWSIIHRYLWMWRISGCGFIAMGESNSCTADASFFLLVCVKNGGIERKTCCKNNSRLKMFASELQSDEPWLTCMRKILFWLRVLANHKLIIQRKSRDSKQGEARNERRFELRGGSK